MNDGLLEKGMFEPADLAMVVHHFIDQDRDTALERACEWLWSMQGTEVLNRNWIAAMMWTMHQIAVRNAVSSGGEPRTASAGLPPEPMKLQPSACMDGRMEKAIRALSRSRAVMEAFFTLSDIARDLAR